MAPLMCSSVNYRTVVMVSAGCKLTDEDCVAQSNEVRHNIRRTQTRTIHSSDMIKDKFLESSAFPAKVTRS